MASGRRCALRATDRATITSMKNGFLINHSSMNRELAIQHRSLADFFSEPVTDLAIIFCIKDRQICIFSHFDTPLSLVQAQGVSGVDGDGRNGLRWSHAHLRARQ